MDKLDISPTRTNDMKVTAADTIKVGSSEFVPRCEGHRFTHTKTGKPRVRNKYPATCHHCGADLPPNEGFAVGRDQSGRWLWECGRTAKYSKVA